LRLQTTGKSRKEACLLSQEDAENTYVVRAGGKIAALRQVKGLLEFLGKVQQEMKLVHHPNWREVRSTTRVVITLIFLFALYFRALEWIFSPLDHWQFNH
jgi:preprotein translocase SecE subunit